MYTQTDYIVFSILILIFIAFLIYLWYTGKKRETLIIIRWLVVEAEKMFGSKTGQYKFDYVLGKLYSSLPSSFKKVVSEETLKQWIEDAVVLLNKRLAESSIIDSNINANFPPINDGK